MENELNLIISLIFIFIILWIVWKSSEVREIPANFEAINIGVRRSASLISQASTASTSTVEENLTSSVEDIADNIFAEASESFNNNSSSMNDYRNATLIHQNDDQLTEEEQIIRDMDQDLPSHSPISTSGGDGDNNETLRRRRRQLSCDDPSTSNELSLTVMESNENSNETTKQTQEGDVEKISIKLKFLNDEIKIDKQAHLNETVLSFKRRNFKKTELESKLIKLIFNGKLLEDDKKTLLQCGIFSEAVVHCLVMQKKTTSATNSPTSNQNSNARRIRNNNSNFFSIEWNNSIMIYVFGMALASITLILCWFARIQYEIYFSFYSTIGLILITTLFIILIPLFSMVLS